MATPTGILHSGTAYRQLAAACNLCDRALQKNERMTRSPSIEYLIGDATAPRGDGLKIIAHVCNDIGGWGRGFVLAISRRWSEPEAAYRRWYEARDGNDFGLGALQLVPVGDETWIANLIGQRGIHAGPDGPPVRYEAIEEALLKVADEAHAMGASVHMPRIGSGLAGGDWDLIESIIERTLVGSGIDTFVYDLNPPAA